MPVTSSFTLRLYLGLGTLLLGACGGSEEPERAYSNVDKVVLFTVDTLRSDQLGSYGNTAFATPAFDRFASQSVQFDRAYGSASITVPSLTSMLTGLQPHRHGVHDQRAAFAQNVVPVQSLAQNQGIKTASFIANICVLQSEARTVFHDGWDQAACGMNDETEQYLWDRDVVDQAMAWLDQQEGPFLLWVHLMDPHAEHRPNPDDWSYADRPVLEKKDQYAAFNEWEKQRSFPNDQETKHLWDLYAAEVIGADREFGRFMEKVDGRPDKDEIAVIFSADHGEELYESWSRYDHGLSLSEGVLWVPLMMRVPGVEPRLVDDVVETLQVAPTILQLFDLAVPYSLDGLSLLNPNPSRGFAYSSVGHISQTIRTKDHRFWLRPGSEAWTREGAPWRADAPWFRDSITLATYGPDKRTTVEYMDVNEPTNKALLKRLGTSLRELKSSMGKVPEASENVGDAETEAAMQKMGYIGYGNINEKK